MGEKERLRKYIYPNEKTWIEKLLNKFMNKILRKASIFILPFLFFSLSLLTLKDYGVNWDTLQHYVRGQIYFRFLTTGDKENPLRDEKDLSYYQKADLDYAWSEKMTIGHPPLTDILMAASNHVFFKALHVLSDIDSYQFIIVFMTFVMACIIALWSYQTYGVFASIVSVLVLYTYPLLFGEQHFNMKDPIVAAYFTGFLYFLWRGITRKKVVSLIVASLFGGLSLGTKFNVIFSIPIVILWFVFYIFHNQVIHSFKSCIGAVKKKLPLPVILGIVGIPIISFLIFFGTYPALWSNPIEKVWSVILYYRQIGGSQCLYVPFTPKWMTFCTDFHTLRLFFTTLPLITLVLLSIGIVKGLKDCGKYNQVTILLIVWFFVTVGRATLPFTALYGGSLRQIMEFIPAVALLSGIGAVVVSQRVQSYSPRLKYFVYGGILFCFIPILISMKSLHPNENLYFNALVGGLRGAVASNFPVATNTYGNGYKQAIDWINNNVPSGSFVYLVQGIGSAVPSYMFRPGITYKGSASYLTGYDGMYYMELNEPGMDISTYHNVRYVNTFLKPLHVIEVDGVPIASIWLNDKAYTKTPYVLDEEKEILSDISINTNDEIVFTLDKAVPLKRIEMRTMDPVCIQAVQGSFVFLSTDKSHFTKLLDETGKFSELAASNHSTASYGFTGQEATQIKLYTYKDGECDWNAVDFTVFGYSN